MPAAGPARWALDESEFAHRDSMITKFEVRALALARLGPRLGDLVWDVGAGSGSVAVECARFGAAVTAVEKTAGRRRRGSGPTPPRTASTYSVVHGAAPTVLADLDDPDAVFIGGGGRELPAIVTACARRARRSVVVAMAALDRVPAARDALAAAGFACDGVLLQSSRLAPLPGDVTRLAATNPVFVLWGVRPPAPTRRSYPVIGLISATAAGAAARDRLAAAWPDAYPGVRRARWRTPCGRAFARVRPAGVLPGHGRGGPARRAAAAATRRRTRAWCASTRRAVRGVAGRAGTRGGANELAGEVAAVWAPSRW